MSPRPAVAHISRRATLFFRVGSTVRVMLDNSCVMATAELPLLLSLCEIPLEALRSNEELAHVLFGLTLLMLLRGCPEG
ncbi:unnamed protein product [Bodo saltans]|uniref:Uncharacterized protein n=1 Tax=Bodo saltans TaxID=75058 RepID=A0A0S4KN14_BODSA|nr:unnamed protein product [Bodo saltans]|eukprot:CUI15007.1 unnamed protein product [Bodo saltans]